MDTETRGRGDTEKRVKVVLGILPERNGVPTAGIFWRFLEIAGTGASFIEQAVKPVHIACNELARSLLKSEFTHLLIMGADHMHPVDIVPRLSRWVEADPSRLVVAGLCFRRGEPYEPLAYTIDEEGAVNAMLDWDPGLIKVDRCGTGAMLISREVFERLPEPWFEFIQYPGGALQGEDIYFCKKCMDAGIQIWVDTTTISPHMGELWINDKVYKAYVRQRIRKAKHDHDTAQEAPPGSCPGLDQPGGAAGAAG